MTIRQAGTSQVLPSLMIPQETREQQILLPVPVYMPVQNKLPFIEANTKEVSMNHLQNDCIIPVFSKDNEVTMSHTQFIEVVNSAARAIFAREHVSEPLIRVSHTVKGRIPEAIHKSASELTDSERTIYYERMMFCMEIPTIYQDIAGNRLNLTVGGVRAYNQENLYTKKTYEKFKVFIGFKNLVCCNLCVSTDGYKACLKAMDTEKLYQQVSELFRSYNMDAHLNQMMSLQNQSMTEHQFAQFLGKSRMYQYLPSEEKKKLPEMLMTDTQIGLVSKAYYDDTDFGKTGEDISMWRVYNLLTGANKSSYIDNFLDRSLNAGQIADGLSKALCGNDEYSWFIN